eukprot:1227643-Lingulodinium_polyedra.AAC.1
MVPVAGSRALELAAPEPVANLWAASTVIFWTMVPSWRLGQFQRTRQSSNLPHHRVPGTTPLK